MDAVILDVGGVLLVPHYDTVGDAFEPCGITLDEARAERAHYFGVQALDVSEEEVPGASTYIRGYAEGAGVPSAHQAKIIERLNAAWRRPNLDIWRQVVRGSI